MLRYIVVLAGCIASAAYAQSLSDQLRSTKSLKCHFGTGFSTDWKSGKSRTKPQRIDSDIVFDGIDLKNGTARVIANLGAGDATVTFSPVGMTVFEPALAVQDFTTIFPVYDKSGNFVAVETRHVNFNGTPTAEQYFGTCKIMQ